MNFRYNENTPHRAYVSSSSHYCLISCTLYSLLRQGPLACCNSEVTSVTLIPFTCYVDLCQHGMACPRVADWGGGLQTWNVAANILNRQSLTADKGWPSSSGAERGVNNSSPYKNNLFRNVKKGLGFGRILCNDI